MGGILQENSLLVDRVISGCVEKVASDDPHQAQAVEHFLRTGELPRSQTRYRGGGLASIKESEKQSDMCETALRQLFNRLEAFLPEEAKSVPSVTPEMVRERVRPMVFGLLRPAWRTVVHRELGNRVFVLNLDGARRALDAEISTGFFDGAWKTLWIYFGDYGLAPQAEHLNVSGMSGGTIAQIRLSDYQMTDPYADVTIHEAAHLLHYLKPKNFGFHVPLRTGAFCGSRV